MVMLTQLVNYTPKGSVEERDLRRIVGGRMVLNKQADELLQKLEAVAADKLLAEWEKSKEAVREQQAKIDKFKAETTRLTMELNRRAEARGKAQSQFDVAQATKKQLGRYASQRDIEAASGFFLKGSSFAGVRAEQTSWRDHPRSRCPRDGAQDRRAF